MEQKMKIMTVTKCSPKEGNPYTRLDVVNLNQSIKSENVKGQIVAPMFISGHSAFDKIPANILDQEVYITVDYQSNDRNPMKPKTVITSIRSKNGTIDLL